METESLSPGRLTLLRRATPDGYVTATRPNEREVAEKLVREGYLKHHRGLVYELTQRGLTEL